MELPSTPRHTAGAIYVVLTLLWGAIAGIIAYNLGAAGLADLLHGRFTSSDGILLTLLAYVLISLLLAVLLLSRISFSANGLKAVLGLALLPLIAAPFDATDMYGAIVYLVPYFFLYKFYKNYQAPPPPKKFGHLRSVK